MKRLIFLLALPVLLYGLRYRAVRYHDYSQMFSALPVSPAERRVAAIESLKSYHTALQSDIVKELESLAKDGSVNWYHSLWIADIILFDATPDAIHHLKRNFSEYSFCIEKKQDAVLFNGKNRVSRSSTKSRSVVKANSMPPHLTSTTESILPDTVVWNLSFLGIPELWRRFGALGTGILVAVFDTGLNPQVPDILGSAWQNPDEVEYFNGLDDDGNGYIDDIWGYSFHDTTSHPYDDYGHGTHVSGTIGGHLGTGIAPQSEIIALKVLDDRGRGNEGDVWAAIEYALERGAHVGNFSIGWRHSSDPPPDRETWRAVVSNAAETGIVMVIAAGNEAGTDTSIHDLRTPGDVPEAITVAAVDSFAARASFSSIGPVEWDDYPYPPGLTKPDISAPGEDVVSVVLPGGYESWDGTSMATPHISGICAMMRQLNPELTHFDIKAILESTAEDLGETGKDNEYGSGLVSPFDALMHTTDMCTIVYSADIPGTLTIVPQMLHFYGDGDTVFIPCASEELRFITDGYELFTIELEGASSSFHFSPLPAGERTVRTGIMEFESGDAIDGIVICGTDTFDIAGFGEITLPLQRTVMIAAAPGFTSEHDTLEAEEDCIFFFLHPCMDFEDSACFSGTMDWEWGNAVLCPGYAHSGEQIWATGLADTYSNSSDSWLISNWTYIEKSAAVSIWQWLDCEATNGGFWDGGNISVDYGAGWHTIYPIGDYPCHLDNYNEIMPWEPAFSGTLTGNYWHKRFFPLHSFTPPCSARIGFHFSSDDNTTRYGWAIDDVSIAARTEREPLIRWLDVLGDTVYIAAYGVHAQIASTEILYSDESTSSLMFFTCDTLLGILNGEPGDTILFRARITDENGACAVYPTDSFITAIIPDDGIAQKVSSSNAECTVISLAAGFRIIAIGEFVEIIDVMGRIVQHENIDGKKNFICTPDASGIYFIKVRHGFSHIHKRVVFLK